MTNSRTINFAILMAFITQVNGSIQMLSPLLDQNTFILVNMLIGAVTAAGAAKWRYITSKSREDKKKGT